MQIFSMGSSSNIAELSSPKNNHKTMKNESHNENQSNALRPKDNCIHLDAVEEHGTNVTSLPVSYSMMSG